MKRKLLSFSVLLVMLLIVVHISARAEGVPAQPIIPVDLTPLLQALIAVLATLVTARLVPWIKARTTASQQATLLALTRTLVFAAEQLYGSSAGKEKLLYVKGKLMERGYQVDVDAIEAMVLQLKLDKPPNEGYDSVGLTD